MDVLLSPEILGLLFLALVLVGVIVVVIRRRRQVRSDDPEIPTDLGQSIDYTSITVEEPTSLVDRFRNAPTPVKVLVILVPLVIIGGLIAVALALTSGPGVAEPPPQTEPAVLIIEDAVVVSTDAISVNGTAANLPSDATVTAVMKENGQDFVWFSPDTAITQPTNDGVIELRLTRAADAAVPKRGAEYSIILMSTFGGQTVNSDPALLDVIPAYASAFYQDVAEAPTAAPTEEPTETPAPDTTAEPTAEPTATPLTATVIGGGRIRREPSVQAEEVGTIARGEQVVLLSRTADGAWYHIQSAAGEGWASSTLLEIAPEVAAQVPGPETPSGLTTTVFNGGNVRPGPGLSFNPPLDQVNAGETVTLLSKTDDGQWFRITNERGITGWVNRTLLNLSVELVDQVPVAGTEEGPITTGTPSPTGLKATVSNGGNVRAAPNLSGRVLDQINANEEVELLAKTANGQWYQIKNIRDVTGWVSSTLLTVDPDVAEQVPVGQ
jgi:uncharacterized protein YgiM (DUF1202 family)